MATIAAGGRNSTDCLCLVMVSNQMLSSAITVEDVIRMYHQCGGITNLRPDVCWSSDMPAISAPSPSAGTSNTSTPGLPPSSQYQQPANATPGSTGTALQDIRKKVSVSKRFVAFMVGIATLIIGCCCLCIWYKPMEDEASDDEDQDPMMFSPRPSRVTVESVDSSPSVPLRSHQVTGPCILFSSTSPAVMSPPPPPPPPARAPKPTLAATSLESQVLAATPSAPVPHGQQQIQLATIASNQEWVPDEVEGEGANDGQGLRTSTRRNRFLGKYVA